MINIKELTENIVEVMELDTCEEMTGMINEVVENLIDGENEEEIIRHIKDVATYGADTGAVPQVIYSKDNDNFYRKYSIEIFEFCNQIEGYYINKNSIDNIVWSLYEAIASAILTILLK